MYTFFSSKHDESHLHHTITNTSIIQSKVETIGSTWVYYNVNILFSLHSCIYRTKIRGSKRFMKKMRVKTVFTLSRHLRDSCTPFSLPCMFMSNLFSQHQMRHRSDVRKEQDSITIAMWTSESNTPRVKAKAYNVYHFSLQSMMHHICTTPIRIPFKVAFSGPPRSVAHCQCLWSGGACLWLICLVTLSTKQLLHSNPIYNQSTWGTQ
jgi:hypothetical protein